MRSFSIQFSQLEVSALKKLTGVKLKISNSQIYQVSNLDGGLRPETSMELWEAAEQG